MCSTQNTRKGSCHVTTTGTAVTQLQRACTGLGVQPHLPYSEPAGGPRRPPTAPPPPDAIEERAVELWLVRRWSWLGVLLRLDSGPLLPARVPPAVAAGAQCGTATARTVQPGSTAMGDGTSCMA